MTLFKKMLLFVIIIVFAVNSIYCDNVTSKYPSANFKTKQNRLLTFNTEKDGLIHVELEFAVPFLSIPTKPSLSMAHGAVANLNIGAIVLAGMMAFGAAIIIPAVYQLVNKKIGISVGGGESPMNNIFDEKHGRSEADTSRLYKIMANLDQALSDHDVDSTSCMQRAICWTVKNANVNLDNGKATSTDKIIDGLVTNTWISYWVSGSVFQAAIDSGLLRVNCAKEYSQCMIDQNAIQMFAKQFINSIYYNK